VLHKMLERFRQIGWEIVVAPELEFYLTEVNSDPDLPIVPPRGRSGQAETSPQPYGLEQVNEFEDIIEEIYDQAEVAELHLDTMIHEGGTAQLEINFNHGDPIELCDQVIIFKRIVRQVALKHGVYATFMAKPMENQPGSAMHLHISATDQQGNNLFGTPEDLPMRSGILWAVCSAICLKSCRCLRPTSIPSGGCARRTARPSTCNGAGQPQLRAARAAGGPGQHPHRKPSARR
jgi:glutamine synthetase